MESNTLVLLQARMRRLERHNRILAVLLCTVVGIGSLAATNRAPSVVHADEVIAQRFTLIDTQGRICSYQQGVGGNVSEGGPITDYPPIPARAPGAPVIPKWRSRASLLSPF